MGPAHKSKRVVTKEFLSFIRAFLKKGGLKEETISLLLDDEIVQYEFLKSFNHKSMGSDNYEQYEIYGDKVVNFCIMNYLFERFPKVVNVGYLSKLEQHLKSKKVLSFMASQGNFIEYINYDPSVAYLYEDEDLEENEEYRSLLEDTFESLIGCVSYQMDKKFMKGIGTIVCYRIIKTFLDSMEISLAYNDVYDAFSRLKQMAFDRKPKWDATPNTEQNNIIFKHDPKTKMVTVEIYGYPVGNKEPIRENRRLLGRATGNIQSETKQEAAERAIQLLVKQFGYKLPIPPSPFESDNKKKFQKKIEAHKMKMMN